MELTIAAAAEAAYQKWKDEWEPLHPTLISVLPNEKRKEPEQSWTGAGTVLDPLSPVFWTKTTFRLLPGVQFTLGKKGQRLYRREAMIWVQVFGPENNGTEFLLDILDEINEFLEGESFDGLDPSGAVNVTEVGGDGKWYQYSATYPVAFYELK